MTSSEVLIPVPQHVLDYILEYLRAEVWPVVARGNNARVEIDLAPHAAEFQVRMFQSRRVQLDRPLARQRERLERGALEREGAK